MVKGISRRVVVVNSPDPRIFEQAIFIVRNDALMRDGVSAQEIVEEARRVAKSYGDRKWNRH
ncbi:MAG: translation initiation factor 2, partial [Oscillospiraceae bacterium]